MNNNSIKLQGVIVDEPVLDEELLMGEKIYAFNLSVPRESGINDILVVRISNRLLCFNNIHKDVKIEITGDLRTYRIHDNTKKRLRIVVFCSTASVIENIDTSINNDVELIGTIGKKPLLRKAKSTDRILCEIQLRVQRSRNKVSIVPIIAWGREATYISEFDVGTEISVKGRFQSRELLRHNGDDMESDVTYEVSASGIQVIDK